MVVVTLSSVVAAGAAAGAAGGGRIPPPFFSSSILSSIQWPLSSNCPPLYYQSLEDLKELRSKEKKQPSGPNHSRLLDPYVDNIPALIEEYFPSIQQHQQQEEEDYFGLLSLALVLLGHGYTDECHNLITPLSWPQDIHFAYKPSIYNQVSNNIKLYATYIHSLVHRREGFNVGEFSMVGFQNANYWSNAFSQLIISSPSSSSATTGGGDSSSDDSSLLSFPHNELGMEVIRIVDSFLQVRRVVVVKQMLLLQPLLKIGVKHMVLQWNKFFKTTNLNSILNQEQYINYVQWCYRRMKIKIVMKNCFCVNLLNKL